VLEEPCTEPVRFVQSLYVTVDSERLRFSERLAQLSVYGGSASGYGNLDHGSSSKGTTPIHAEQGVQQKG